MHEYLVRVRRDGETYSATVRELSPGQHPELLVSVGEPVHGHPAANPTAAIVSAFASARLETFPEPRVSRYAC